MPGRYDLPSPVRTPRVHRIDAVYGLVGQNKDFDHLRRHGLGLRTGRNERDEQNC